MKLIIQDTPKGTIELLVSGKERLNEITDLLIEQGGLADNRNCVYVLENSTADELLSYFPYPNKSIQHSKDIELTKITRDEEVMKLVTYETPVLRAQKVQPKLQGSDPSYIKEFALCQLGSNPENEVLAVKTGSVMAMYFLAFIFLVLFLIFGILKMIGGGNPGDSAPLYVTVLVRALEFLLPGLIFFGIGKLMELKNKKKLKQKQEQGQEDT